MQCIETAQHELGVWCRRVRAQYGGHDHVPRRPNNGHNTRGNTSPVTASTAFAAITASTTSTASTATATQRREYEVNMILFACHPCVANDACSPCTEACPLLLATMVMTCRDQLPNHTQHTLHRATVQFILLNALLHRNFNGLMPSSTHRTYGWRRKHANPRSATCCGYYDRQANDGDQRCQCGMQVQRYFDRFKAHTVRFSSSSAIQDRRQCALCRSDETEIICFFLLWRW
jgi:hypothetical protein